MKTNERLREIRENWAGSEEISDLGFLLARLDEVVKAARNFLDNESYVNEVELRRCLAELEKGE